MSHSHHGGGGGSSGLNMPVAYAFAHDYWYIAASVVGALVVVRATNYLDARNR
jgi:hypothetical protein